MEAMFYSPKDENQTVQCGLCPRECLILPGKFGACRVRKNINGKLISLVYGRPCAIHMDPIEKKPLFHFMPGEFTFSLATVGCNLFCNFCQNWEMSKEFCNSDFISKEYSKTGPKNIVELCKKNKSRIISFTYTEPTVFYEYMLETAKLAKKSGLKTVMVSNGFINEAPLRKLCKYIDAANIDLKGFNDDFYRDNCRASLAPILRSLKILKEEGVWLEITTLVIPGLNDNLDDVEKMAKWISESLGRSTPLHLTRFHPDYKLIDKPGTSIALLEKTKAAAEKYLDFVYIGNTLSESSTACPDCNRVVIRRSMLRECNVSLIGGKCPKCKAAIPGVWA